MDQQLQHDELTQTVLLGERIEDREHHLLCPTERLKEKVVLINYQLQVLSDEMVVL